MDQTLDYKVVVRYDGSSQLSFIKRTPQKPLDSRRQLRLTTTHGCIEISQGDHSFLPIYQITFSFVAAFPCHGSYTFEWTTHFH